MANIRGVDRDMFYLEYGGWDHHSTMKERLATKFEELNMALDKFWSEMKVQNNEDKVIMVSCSDFGRALTPNSQDGSDRK